MARFSRISKNFWQELLAGIIFTEFSQNFRGSGQISQRRIIFAEFSQKWLDLAVFPTTFRREEIIFAEFSQNFRGNGQISQGKYHVRRIFAKCSQKWRV